MSSNSACDSCAFRPGSVTHDKEPYNAFRGQVAALSGLPFFCHHGLNWRKRILTKFGHALDCDGKIQRLQVCAGWKEQVRGTITPATKKRMIRRGLGVLIMDELDAAIAEDDPKERRELWKDLHRSFRMLIRAAGLKIKGLKR